MKAYKVLTINPGSTSTKVALFEGDQCLYSRNVSHEANELGKFKTLPEQLPYRRDTILRLLKEAGISLEDVDVFVGRGGGLLAVEGGTYGVTDLMLEHARTCANGVIHPAALGPQLAHEFAETYGAKAMVVNPPDVDELQELARMTGIKGVYRIIHLHALNLKETAIRHSRNVMDRAYEECNYVVCHIGGGISVSAHCRGKMIDGYDIVGGEGPMAPTRCGSISVANLLEYMETSGLGVADVRKLCTRTGGFVNHVGISDAIELTDRAASGDRYAEMLWDSMIYQIEKCIGSMAAALHGQVDGILLGGGMVHNQDLVKQITDACSFIAPVTAYPGEFEMEAMAAGAIRVLEGGEELKTYTGKPVWDGFDWE
ncbi:butyrate kinase [Enterocloster citroniae]|uniref:butyrate kinase n=1 Tax=Enterocloster citroniae TaxID=358743 RepID=UPI0032BFA6DB